MKNNTGVPVVGWICGTLLLLGVLALIGVLALHGTVTGANAMEAIIAVIGIAGGTFAVHTGVNAGANAAGSSPSITVNQPTTPPTP